MDGGIFDRLTRLLAGRLTRRSGLAAAAAAAVASRDAAEARRDGDGNGNRKAKDKGKDDGRGPGKRRERGDGRGPRVEGPCGDGSRKDNACMKDGQCCTGLCNLKRARRNEDGKGRCRCIQRGRPCQEDRNCCGGRPCARGVCGGEPAPAPATCGASGAACANDDACCGGFSCMKGVCSKDCVASGGACASRGACCSGLSCIDDVCAACESLGGACASDANCCDGLICKEGACAACAPSVCLTGCDYDNVAAAWAAASAGDTIYIGPGIYPTSILIDKSMTLAACPGESGVVLIPDYSTPGQDSYFSVLSDIDGDDTAYEVTMRNLTLRGRFDGDSYDVLLRSSFMELIDWTLEDVSLRNAYAGIAAPNGTIEIYGGEFTNCSYGGFFEYSRTDRDVSMKLVVKGLTVSYCDSYGIYHFPYYDSPESVVDIQDCVFRDNVGYGLGISGDRPFNGTPEAQYSVKNCTFTGNQYASLVMTGGHTTVTGCTFRHNPGNGGYGPVHPYDGDVTLIDCVIENNSTTKEGGGIYMIAQDRQLSTLKLEGSTVVTNNTADNGGGMYLSSKANRTYTVQGAGTRVSGNAPNNCVLFVSGSSEQSVSCDTWQP